MRFNIQNIMFPVSEVCDEEQMYFRYEGSLAQKGESLCLKENACCDFSTYFNSFSLNKWLNYTELSNLHLALVLQGKFIVKIYSACWFRGKVIRECMISQSIFAEKKQEYTFDVNIAHNDNIYFRIISIADGSTFYGGSYFTDVSPQVLHKVEMDIVMCTYKRENYVRRNVNLIVNDYIHESHYNGSGHLKVKIVDNGQTLSPEDIEEPGIVKLYPNKNVGGSGGFCRGMIESLQEGKATHILFLDDDVLVQVEAFERTYNMLALLKKDYQKAFIGGAMLRLDEKNIQHENLAGFKGNHLVSLKQNLDLNKYTDVLFNEKMEKVAGIYCAWWYCCIPTTVASMSNLPYPFFVRMDDIEYSIRNIRYAISLNGICVWHEAFDRKYSTLMENYFMFRNNLVVNMIHQYGGRNMAIWFFCRRFVHDIFRYDYGGAELLLDGVERVLEGPKFFRQVDTVKDLQEHGKKQQKLTTIKNIRNVDLLYQTYKDSLMRTKESLIWKGMRFLTWNGHLIPDFFLHRQGFAEYGYWNNSKMYFGHREVVVCDKDFITGAILRIQRWKATKLVARWASLSCKLLFRYTELQKAYQDEFRMMTGESFWREYLKP